MRTKISSPIEECERLIIAGELEVVHKYFKQWACQNLVERTTKDILRNKIAEFVESMISYYEHKDTSGSLRSYITIDNHIDNMFLDIMKDGLDTYCVIALNAVSVCTTSRVTVNKIIKRIESDVANYHKEAIMDAMR